VAWAGLVKVTSTASVARPATRGKLRMGDILSRGY
jgi:hypothetical protein